MVDDCDDDDDDDVDNDILPLTRCNRKFQIGIRELDVENFTSNDTKRWRKEDWIGIR